MIKLLKVFSSVVVALSLIASFSPAGAAAHTPMDAIRVTVDAVLDTLKDESLSQPDKKHERGVRIRSLIRDRFDFQEMAMRSLARHWETLNAGEKKEFVEIFSELLQSSYIGKIESYTDEKITYDKEAIKGDGKYGVVATTIIARNVNIPIEYKLVLKRDKWWVYDVTIEGVSFISTYREQYNRIIIRESYTGLLKKMRSKLDEINSLEGKESGGRS